MGYSVDWRPDGQWFESRCGKNFSELWQFRLPRFVICPCLSDETLKAVGPFYLVSISVVTIPNVAMRYVSRYLGHDAIRIAILVYRVSQCLDLQQK